MDKLKATLKKFYFSFIWLAILFILIDQITKWVVQINVQTGEIISVIPGFVNIVLSHNEGAAFGFGDSSGLTGRIIFILISSVVGVALSIYYAKKYKNMSTPLKIVFSLLLAGCFGNLIDRAFYWNATVGFNGVIDWIDFYVGTSHFATFNIADSCLTIGTILFIIVMVIDENKSKKANVVEEKNINKKDENDGK